MQKYLAAIALGMLFTIGCGGATTSTPAKTEEKPAAPAATEEKPAAPATEAPKVEEKK